MSVLEITVLLLPTVVSAFLGFVNYSYQKKDEKREAERKKEQERLEQAEAIRELKNNAMAEGMQSLLRDSIIRIHHDCMRRKKTRYYEVQNMEHLYQSYHNLGGNGMATKLYKEFCELPTAPEQRD